MVLIYVVKTLILKKDSVTLNLKLWQKDIKSSQF